MGDLRLVFFAKFGSNLNIAEGPIGRCSFSRAQALGQDDIWIYLVILGIFVDAEPDEVTPLSDEHFFVHLLFDNDPCDSENDVVQQWNFFVFLFLRDVYRFEE